MTEPGAGSDLQGIRTNAIKDGSEWVLNGSKVFITNGQMADMVIVVAKTDLEAKRVSFFGSRCWCRAPLTAVILGCPWDFAFSGRPWYTRF